METLTIGVSGTAPELAAKCHDLSRRPLHARVMWHYHLTEPRLMFSENMQAPKDSTDRRNDNGQKRGDRGQLYSCSHHIRGMEWIDYTYCQ